MEKYTRNRNVIDGSVDDHQIMIHIEKGKYYGLNAVGKRIWEIIEQPKTTDEIVLTLLEEYNVDPESCKKEVIEFIQKGIASDIISTQ